MDPDSPAEKAGLKVGDVIVEIRDSKVNDYRSIQTILDRLDLRVGDKLSMKVFREGEVLSYDLHLEEVPRR